MYEAHAAEVSCAQADLLQAEDDLHVARLDAEQRISSTGRPVPRFRLRA